MRDWLSWAGEEVRTKLGGDVAAAEAQGRGLLSRPGPRGAPARGLRGAAAAELCHILLDGPTDSEDYLSSPPTATFGLLQPTIDPVGPEGHRLLVALRRASSSLAPRYGLEVSIAGIAANSMDMVEAVYDILPAMVVATYAAMLVFLAVVFCSVAIPLRSVVTNVMTIGISFGTAVAIYQDGALDWLGFGGTRSAGGLYWMDPVVLFFVLSGLSLDYDIFLLMRITEFRGQGLKPLQAVQRGLAASGGVITAAGVVMALAFGGLLFSGMPSLNVISVTMVIAVLYDTFLARSVLNPVLLSLLGRWSWWPSPLSRDCDASSRVAVQE